MLIHQTMSEILLIITKGEHTADISRGKNLKILLAHETSNNSQKKVYSRSLNSAEKYPNKFPKSHYESNIY